LRRIINQFKEPIYKDDLKRVLMYCSLNAVLFGILAGALQFFANITIGIGFSLLVYFIAYMIGRELRDRVFTYHILYSVLGIVFFLVGYVFYNISYLTFITRDFFFSVKIIFSIDGFMGLVFPFLDIRTYFGQNILNNILDIFVFVFSVMTIWRMSTYRK
jgi:hypothetical protein